MATPYAHCRVAIITFIISEEELIKKKGPLDPLEDDDDIKWKINPFDTESLDGSRETPEELMPRTTFKDPNS